MKAKKIIILSSLVLTSVGATRLGILFTRDKEPQIVHANYIWDYPFECDEWLYSGKGFYFDFTFNKDEIIVNKRVSVELLTNEYNDRRLTNKVYINFYTNGDITSTVGNIIKNDDDTYTFSAMFSEFEGLLNVSEGATGHETCNKCNFREADIEIKKVRAGIIDTRMNVAPRAEIRDETEDNLNGLMFKCYVPEVKANTKYGMAIVPNEYLGELTSDYCNAFTTAGKRYVENYCVPQQITSSDPIFDRYHGGYYIKCSMIDVKEANYFRDFSAVPFEESNGTRRYAWNINEEKDNLYDACTRAKINNTSLSTNATSYMNGILNNVKNRSAALKTANLDTYVVNNTDQYMKDASVTSVGNQLVVKAAKGETETAQIVLSSKSGGNINYFAAVSNLENGSNIISNDNIETDIEHYINVETNWSGKDGHVSRLSNFYPNGAETLPTGWWPDALIPMDVGVRTGKNVISTTNGANQGLFFRIKIPGNAVAGTYTGNVVIYAVGEGLITVPIQLTVYNFSIENRTDSNNIIILNRSEMNALYQMGYNSAITSEHYKNGMKFLAERGVSGGLVAQNGTRNGQLEAYVDEVKKFVQNGKTNTYLLDFCQDTVSMEWYYRKSSSQTTKISITEDVFCCDDSSDEYGFKYGLKSILNALVEASTNDLDLLEGAVIYDPHADEPNDPEDYVRNVLNYNSLRTAIDYVKAHCDFTGKSNVLNSLDNIFYLCTAGPENQFVGTKNSKAYCDVSSISNVSGADKCACATLSDLKYTKLLNYVPNMMWAWNSGEESGSGQCWDEMKKIYDGTNPDGYTAWEYNCIQPISPYPSYATNAQMIRTRTNRWREFNLHLDGFMNYMANRTQYYKNDVSTPKTEEQIFNGEIYYEDSSGDGLLMYPVHNMFGYANRNLYYLSTLRLENTAESNDDVNYLYLAKELIAQQTNPSSYETRLKNICETLSIDNCPAKVTNNSETLNTARTNLVNLILELQ